MRKSVFVALFFSAALSALGQAAAPPQALPKDPREILAMAAPYYNFNDPALKPWHLKATYQLYDDQGKPAEQGTFEYWWASPKVRRSSWTRPSMKHTDWYTADGRHAYEASGDGLSYYENKLESELFSPLPESRDLDPAAVKLVSDELHVNDVKLSCTMAVPIKLTIWKGETASLGIFPTYCFGPSLPVLRLKYSIGNLAVNFNSIVEVQGCFLARKVDFHQGKQHVLTADVVTVEGMSPTDPALAPTVSAIMPTTEKVPVGAGLAVGMLVKKQMPLYPLDAKNAGASGTVVLQATIGRDGRIRDLRVVSAPWPSLAAAALMAVSEWQYRPYMLNGEPVEVETTINVIFKLGP
jgi:TonB family protein